MVQKVKLFKLIWKKRIGKVHSTRWKRRRESIEGGVEGTFAPASTMEMCYEVVAFRCYPGHYGLNVGRK
jgi:hypothetical protein